MNLIWLFYLLSIQCIRVSKVAGQISDIAFEAMLSRLHNTSDDIHFYQRLYVIDSKFRISSENIIKSHLRSFKWFRKSITEAMQMDFINSTMLQLKNQYLSIAKDQSPKKDPFEISLRKR